MLSLPNRSTGDAANTVVTGDPLCGALSHVQPIAFRDYIRRRFRRSDRRADILKPTFSMQNYERGGPSYCTSTVFPHDTRGIQ